MEGMILENLIVVCLEISLTNLLQIFIFQSHVEINMSGRIILQDFKKPQNLHFQSNVCLNDFFYLWESAYSLVFLRSQINRNIEGNTAHFFQGLLPFSEHLTVILESKYRKKVKLFFHFSIFLRYHLSSWQDMRNSQIMTITINVVYVKSFLLRKFLIANIPLFKIWKK